MKVRGRVGKRREAGKVYEGREGCVMGWKRRKEKGKETREKER